MHPLAAFRPPFTRTTVNSLVWVIGLALQLSLFAVLFTRGIARKFPIFTSLIGFYLLRSISLFLIFGHVDLSDYHSLYNNLQLVDLLFQAAVAIEITVHLLRRQAGWTLRSLTPVVYLALATLCTMLTATMLPTHSPIPVDRTQLFFSFLMVLLFTWSLSIPALLTRHIAAGFALYGIINICANFGRTYAALHDNAPAYAIWSYALAGIYLVVVVFWLLTLKPLQTQPLESTVPL